MDDHNRMYVWCDLRMIRKEGRPFTFEFSRRIIKKNNRKWTKMFLIGTIDIIDKLST